MEKYENILLFHFPSDTAALVKMITWHALSCFFNTLPFNLHLFESLAIGHGRRWVVKDHDKNTPGRRSNLVKMFMIRHFKFKGCSENRKCCFSLSTTTYSTLMNLVYKNESDEPLFFAHCQQPIVLQLMFFCHTIAKLHLLQMLLSVRHCKSETIKASFFSLVHKRIDV